MSAPCPHVLYKFRRGESVGLDVLCHTEAAGYHWLPANPEPPEPIEPGAVHLEPTAIVLPTLEEANEAAKIHGGMPSPAPGCKIDPEPPASAPKSQPPSLPKRHQHPHGRDWLSQWEQDHES